MFCFKTVVHVSGCSLRLKATSISRESLFSQVSKETLVLKIGSLNIETMNFGSRLSLILDNFRETDFSVWNFDWPSRLSGL